MIKREGKILPKDIVEIEEDGPTDEEVGFNQVYQLTGEGLNTLSGGILHFIDMRILCSVLGMPAMAFFFNHLDLL